MFKTIRFAIGAAVVGALALLTLLLAAAVAFYGVVAYAIARGNEARRDRVGAPRDDRPFIDV